MASYMISKLSYLNQPCERCGGKKTVVKIRKGRTQTLSGSAAIEYSQIVCINNECQKQFELKLEERIQKEELVRLKREENKQQGKQKVNS